MMKINLVQSIARFLQRGEHMARGALVRVPLDKFEEIRLNTEEEWKLFVRETVVSRNKLWVGPPTVLYETAVKRLPKPKEYPCLVTATETTEEGYAWHMKYEYAPDLRRKLHLLQ